MHAIAPHIARMSDDDLTQYRRKLKELASRGVGLTAVSRASGVHYSTLKAFMDDPEYALRADARSRLSNYIESLIVEPRRPREGGTTQQFFDEGSMMDFYREFAEESGLPGWEDLRQSEREVVRAKFEKFISDIQSDIAARRAEAFREMRKSIMPSYTHPQLEADKTS